MQQSTNYNFNLPEGTDLVNLLTQLIPNWSSLDSILRGIQNNTFETATETVALGVHALTRLDPDAKLLKWVATANYTAGETFTIDGTPIAASTPSGNTLATGAYVSGAIVIAAINSDETAMTVFVTGTNVASDSERLGGELPSYYATDQDMETAKQDIEDLDNLMGNTSISAIGDGTVTGAISALDADLTDNGKSFKFAYDAINDEYGYYDANNVFHPFKSGLEETTLWTNSSPTSSFAGQAVALSDDITNYDYIRVYWRYNTTDATEVSVLMSVSDFQESATSGKPNMAIGVRTSSPTKRGVNYSSNTSVGFASAVNDVGNVSNGNANPTKITGCK